MAIQILTYCMYVHIGRNPLKKSECISSYLYNSCALSEFLS